LASVGRGANNGDAGARAGTVGNVAVTNIVGAQILIIAKGGVEGVGANHTNVGVADVSI